MIDSVNRGRNCGLDNPKCLRRQNVRDRTGRACSRSGENAPEDVIKWVAEIAELTTPDAIEFSDGSQEEWDRLTSQMVESGMFTKLNEEKRPNSSWLRLQAVRRCAC